MSSPETTHTVRIVPDQSGWRLDRALAALIPTLSRERVKALISTGFVVSKGVPVRDPATKVKPDILYALTVPAPTDPHNIAEDIPLRIVFEDDHLLVVDKPAGLVVHPAAGNLDGTLVNALLHHCAGRLSGIGGVARPGIVHRIDKDTSGLMVVAKTDPAHEGLAAQFAKHSMERCYNAIVAGVPRLMTGTVEGALARSAQDRKKMAIVSEGRGKHAITHWRMTERLRESALMECRLETGRTHQIRVHMTSIGHPLLGDPVYGRPRSEHKAVLKELDFTRQALHATTLGFSHPVSGEVLNFQSPLPSDMQRLLSELRL